MFRRQITQTEFNNEELQKWIRKEYLGHYHTFLSLVDRLNRDGFVVDTKTDKAEVLKAINLMIIGRLIVVSDIIIDSEGQIFDCQFKITG